jgi:hypothetical protein
VLDPKRAVLVERRYALLKRDEILARLTGGGANEIPDRLFRWTQAERFVFELSAHAPR